MRAVRAAQGEGEGGLAFRDARAVADRWRKAAAKQRARLGYAVGGEAIFMRSCMFCMANHGSNIRGARKRPSGPCAARFDGRGGFDHAAGRYAARVVVMQLGQAFLVGVPGEPYQALQVREAPSWPRSWASFSLL